MLIDFVTEIPVANTIKFTRDGVDTTQRASFDQRRYADSEHATMEKRQYLQLMEKTDALRPQFYTNYPMRQALVVNCNDTVLATIVPDVVMVYTDKKYRSTCLFSSIGGKLFIYFADAQEYTDEDFLVTGNLVSLNGKLPAINAKVGDLLRYKIGVLDFESADIQSIAWSPSLQAEGYLTDIDITLLTPVAGLVEITYDEKEADLYVADIDLTAFSDVGIVFVKLNFGVIAYTLSYISEPINLQATHRGTIALQYRHTGNFNLADIWSYLYGIGEYNVMRFPAQDYALVTAGEVDINTNDTGVDNVLRAVPFRQILFKVLNVPSWIVDKFMVAFSHDTKLINGYFWEIQNYGSFDLFADLDIGNYEVNLRQKDDRTKVTSTSQQNLTAAFTTPTIEDVAFGGAVVPVTFNTNSGRTFHFLSLPSWIDSSLSTFTDNDTFNLTIDPNATFFERVTQLIAVCDIDGLQATIDINQLYDTSVPLFIDVDDIDVILNGAAASNQLLNVSSSGDYDIVISGAHSFTAAKESGFTQLRISEPTQNSGSTDRVGVVRLELQANPSIFVEIDVTQTPFAGMISVVPGLVMADPLGEDLYVDVNVVAGTQWQASSAQNSPPIDLAHWLNFDDSTIFTASEVGFHILVEGKPPYVPNRIASVTFYNIANPADAVVLQIEQNT